MKYFHCAFLSRWQCAWVDNTRVNAWLSIMMFVNSHRVGGITWTWTLCCTLCKCKIGLAFEMLNKRNTFNLTVTVSQTLFKYILHIYQTQNLSCLLLANVSRSRVAVPVIPVPHSEPEDVLVLEEGEAVLAVPVVGLVPHPVIPGVSMRGCDVWRRPTIAPLCQWSPTSSRPRCARCESHCRWRRSTTVCPTWQGKQLEASNQVWAQKIFP